MPRQLGPVLWTAIPEVCPGCGGRVDQAESCRAARPACRFCREPLACSPKPHLQLDAGSGSTRFVAELQLSTDHGRPIFSGYRPTIQLGPEQTRASITLDPPSAVVAPGETVECLVDLVDSLTVVEGATFTIVEGRVVAGSGTVRVLLWP